MQSIREIIRSKLKTIVLNFAIAVALIFLVWNAITLRYLNRNVEKLVLDYVMSLSESSLLSQDVIAIQREAQRFARTLEGTENYRILVEIALNQRPIARAGRDIPFVPLASVLETRKTLPSGEALEVKVTISFFERFLLSLGFLILLEGILFFAFRNLRSSLTNTMEQFTDPLKKAADWIRGISSSLPLGNRLIPNLQAPAITEFSTLHESLHTLLERMRVLEIEVEKSAAQRARADLAIQVAHDIRSPLSVLGVIERDIGAIPEKQQNLFRETIKRIRDIADGLLKDNAPNPSLESVALADILKDVIRQKRVEIGKRDVTLNEVYLAPQGAQVKIDRKDFVRVLSNLLNNAIESISGKGTVSIKIFGEGGDFVLDVTDSGCGISPENLAKLGSERFSIGKNNGNGLGFLHAKRCVDTWGAKMTVSSEIGKGTTVRIRFTT